MNTTKETGLTREDIQKHAGHLIKSRREALNIPAQSFIDRLGIGSRKTLWEWEGGRAWPRPRYLVQVEEILGFRPNSLQELFRLVGSHVDISELKVSDLLAQPKVWREPDPVADMSDVVLIQELTRRLYAKDEELTKLRKELAARSGEPRNLYDLAADDSPFKAALERETGA